MMDRRTFVTATGAVAAATMVGSSRAVEAQGGARDYYELRKYQVDTEEQKRGVLAYFRDAAIPALNRIGVSPVGVFEPVEEMGPVYALLCHRSAESYGTATRKLLADKEYVAKGDSFLNATLDSPAYARMEVSFMISFSGMPVLERPVTTPGRIFEVRDYRSPSVKTGQKKIEMFKIGRAHV